MGFTYQVLQNRIANRSIDMNHSYKQLVGMVLRLVARGMTQSKATLIVSEAYSCDRDSLVEWVTNHHNNTGGK